MPNLLLLDTGGSGPEAAAIISRRLLSVPLAPEGRQVAAVDRAAGGDEAAAAGSIKALMIVEDNRRMTCCGLSKCGRYLAVCDDSKTLTLWNCRSWTRTRTYPLTSKGTRLAFTEDSKFILVAEKQGDVLMMEVGEGTEELQQEPKRPSCIFGHLSMLLDLLVTPDSKYVVTADRDEKIRVSHFPNAYNIHGFCLGHTNYVASLTLLAPASSSSAKTQILVSASGDGTLRSWDYLRCCQLDVVKCSDHVDPTSSIVPFCVKNWPETGGSGSCCRVAALAEKRPEKKRILMVYRVDPGGKMTFLNCVSRPEGSTIWDSELTLDDLLILEGHKGRKPTLTKLDPLTLALKQQIELPYNPEEEIEEALATENLELLDKHFLGPPSDNGVNTEERKDSG